MRKKVTNREKLDREVEALDEDQVLEVLEYITIMRSLRHQEVNPRKFKEEVTELLTAQGNAHRLSLLNEQKGDVLVFPRTHPAASE